MIRGVSDSHAGARSGLGIAETTRRRFDEAVGWLVEERRPDERERRLAPAPHRRERLAPPLVADDARDPPVAKPEDACPAQLDGRP
jgi:hypothetical protein